jgi:hypothetical protein
LFAAKGYWGLVLVVEDLMVSKNWLASQVYKLLIQIHNQFAANV